MKKRKLINRTTYLRSKKGFTSVSNEATHGKLSAGALGILVILLSNVDTFIIYKSEIEKRSGFGETKFNEYWDELVQNGFIYSLKQPKGMISYHYVIVNEPSHESNKNTLKEIFENHTPFSKDGESSMNNQMPNSNSDKQGNNIYSTNQELSNQELSNSPLAISKTYSDVDELKNYWYENIHTSKLSESEEKEILTQELFVSTLNHTVSSFIHNKTLCEKIKWKYSLKSFYYVFNMTVRDLKFNNKPLTVIDITEEVISFIQK
jgi:hypothetical protein